MKTRILSLLCAAAMVLAMASGCAATAVPQGTLGSITTTTIDGEDITGSIFADYDLTMIIIWATWCGYCVQSMSELEALYQSMPDSINLIGICTDGDTQGALASQILTTYGVGFTNLLPSESLETTLLSTVTGYPSAVFVDKDGNLVGSGVVGSPRDAQGSVIAGYSAAIDAALAELGL